MSKGCTAAAKRKSRHGPAARETGDRVGGTDASSRADTRGSEQGPRTRQERFGLYTATEIQLVLLTWTLKKGEEGEFYVLCFLPRLKIFKSIPIFFFFKEKQKRNLKNVAFLTGSWPCGSVIDLLVDLVRSPGRQSRLWTRNGERERNVNYNAKL